ncbi:MAG: hypothetical protein KC733_04895 [Candidatus Omnitrophica bacterium]|nr:hypothetical protein [Candidatus Omnitrophota bacterium]
MTDWFWKNLNRAVGWGSLLLFSALVIFLANVEIKDLDIWLHLAVGKFILKNLQIPFQDFLSCTVAGTQWVNHEWLFQVIVYSFYTLAGTGGLITLQVLVVGFTFFHLIILGFNRDKLFIPVSLLFLVLLVYKLRLTLRPDMFSLLFFILFIYTLANQLKTKQSIFMLFILQVLWTNIHGFYIFGPCLIAIFILAEWGKRRLPLPFQWKEISGLDDQSYKNLKSIFIGTILACFLNPNFIDGVWYPLKVLVSLGGDHRIFFKYITELQNPISFQTIFSLQNYPIYKLLIVLSGMSFLYNFRRIELGSLFLWIIFLVFSLNALRNIVFFAVIAYLTILINFEKILSAKQESTKRQSQLFIIAHAIIILILFSYFNKIVFNGYYDFETMTRKSEYGGISLRNYPTKAVKFLQENKVAGNFYNDFNSGAYLLGQVFPSIKVFIDGRTEVYGAEFFTEYKRILDGNYQLFQKAADKYQLTGVFLNLMLNDPPGRLIQSLSQDPQWHLVYFDYDAVIFLKDVEWNYALIKEKEIDLSRWQTKEMDIVQIETRPIVPFPYAHRAQILFELNLLDQAQAEIDQALTLMPHYAEGNKLLGKIMLKRMKYKEAFWNFRKAKIINPSDLETQYYLAKTLNDLGRIELAKKRVIRMLQQNPDNSKLLFLLSLIYVKQKQFEKALVVMRKGRVDVPGADEDLIAIGDTLVEDKEYERAKEVYTFALETGYQENVLFDRILKLEKIKGQ